MRVTKVSKLSHAEAVSQFLKTPSFSVKTNGWLSSRVFGVQDGNTGHVCERQSRNVFMAHFFHIQRRVSFERLSSPQSFFLTFIINCRQITFSQQPPMCALTTVHAKDLHWHARSTLFFRCFEDFSTPGWGVVWLKIQYIA